MDLLIARSDDISSDRSRLTSVAEGVQVIEVTAKKYEFSPSPIRVKQGTKVQLKITAANHAHGFRITFFAAGAETAASPGLVFSTFPDCVKIEEGQTQNRRIRCADSWDLSI